MGQRYWKAPYNNMCGLKSFTMPISDLSRASLYRFLRDLRIHITKTLGRERKNPKQEIDLISASINYHIQTLDETFHNPISRPIKDEFALSSKDQK